MTRTPRPSRRHIALPEELFPAIVEYQFNQRLETRTDAIVRLIRAGLAAEARVLPRAPARKREPVG